MALHPNLRAGSHCTIFFLLSPYTQSLSQYMFHFYSLSISHLFHYLYSCVSLNLATLMFPTFHVWDSAVSQKWLITEMWTRLIDIFFLHLNFFVLLVFFATIIPAISRVNDQNCPEFFFTLFSFFIVDFLPWVLKEKDTKIFDSVRRIFCTHYCPYTLCPWPLRILQCPGILSFVCNKLSQAIS